MKKTLYLECCSGISGDMVAAALLDLGADEAVLRRALASLPVSGFEVKISRVKKSGLDACDFNVVLDAAHENHDHDMAYLYGHTAAQCHEHEHEHLSLEHTHRHTHDEHHQHEHAEDASVDGPHSHAHQHVAIRHNHPHFPDIHHRHRH